MLVLSIYQSNCICVFICTSNQVRNRNQVLNVISERVYTHCTLVTINLRTCSRSVIRFLPYTRPYFGNITFIRLLRQFFSLSAVFCHSLL